MLVAVVRVTDSGSVAGANVLDVEADEKMVRRKAVPADRRVDVTEEMLFVDSLLSTPVVFQDKPPPGGGSVIAWIAATSREEKLTSRSKISFELRAAGRTGRYDGPRRIGLVTDQKRVLFIGNGREKPTSFLEASDEFYVLEIPQSRRQIRSRSAVGVSSRQLTFPEPLRPCCLHRATSCGRFSE